MSQFNRRTLAVLHQQGKVSQFILVIAVLLITAVISLAIFMTGKSKTKEIEGKNAGHTSEEEHGHAEKTGNGEHQAEEDVIELTAQQMVEQGIVLAQVSQTEVSNVTAFPAKLTVNTDQQAHISPSFAGNVVSVNVQLGQNVKKGQILASLLVPDLVDQQANLQVAQANLELMRQDYQREQRLWSQGISAKQDYQRALNAYKQAQIQVQASKSRLTALGASSGSNGRYILTSPISGVISKKDLIVGENVQLADQLFTIDQLDQLWLEFVVPSSHFAATTPNQQLEFKSLQTGNTFNAQIQSLNTEADIQTGRLQVRAKVLSNAAELRPNLMVNVMLKQNNSTQALSVLKSAIQKVDGQDVVFISSTHDQKIEFKVQPIVIGQISSDGQRVEIKSGLKLKQAYVTQGSFLLKSELEKGEASHEH